jgi:hypothetical protein
MGIVRAVSILNLILLWSGNMSSITVMIKYILPIAIPIHTAIYNQYFLRLRTILSCELYAEDPHSAEHLQTIASTL